MTSPTITRDAKVVTAEQLKAPFPWFGGKSRIADEVWTALGPVDNYVEPFAGSMAVLLLRPDNGWQTGAETVNDADSYLSNFWRALAADPEQVAHFAEWPVNETDLLARHIWLVNTGKERIASMEADPEFFDAKVAGWWVWGINSWIGSRWCSGNGPHRIIDGMVTDDRQLPHLSNAGKGVNRQRPHLSDAGRGVNRQRLHLGDAGRGVNRQLPHLGNRDKGGQLRPNPMLQDYFFELANRLRRVRVCCGDWSRVVTNGALSFGDTVGIFLDPPYLGDVRAKDLYRVDNHDISNQVREWAIANGDNPRYRIVLAGYEDEHALKMPDSWRKHSYKANRAYGSSGNPDSDNASNRNNERLWFSSTCLEPQPELFR
jgi:site-specific DNA-adenine methylase